jgi:16S rRNA (cytosine967-C5)-methyltransferase
MIAPARLASYEILMAVSSGRADLPAAVADARESLRDDRDRALAADIATGVQRWRGALDHVIEHFARRTLSRLDDEVVEILRLSSYQILHLSRVPVSAVVDDAVNLTKKVGKASARGLVNAVLRTISRQRNDLPLPPRPADPADRDAAVHYLSVSLSHPRWLAARWYDRLGLERAAAWAAFNNDRAPLTLRANRALTTPGEVRNILEASGVHTEPGRWAPDALIVRHGQPLRDPGTRAGLFVVQDEASQLVALLAGEQPGPLVLDACASPGGKATAIAAALRVGSTLVACDVRARRVSLLRQTVESAHVANVRLVQADLLANLPFGQVFSCVLVDAPCSGLGTLRRDPDIRWRRREEDLPVLARAQTRMLQNAAAVVARGGRLVYATCSSEPEENDEVVDAFLAAHPDFTPVDAGTVHSALPLETVDARGRFRTSPDAHHLEVFFGAVLERTRHL